MKKHIKPILVLLLITPFLTELLSGNLQPQIFFTPHIFFLLVVVAYGFPILVIRELSVRWRLGLAGTFLLGLAYGVLNEGILAKTILLSENVPIPTFDNYGFIGGFSIAWALLIIIWHALHAVVFPILFVHYLFPAHKSETWLNKPLTVFAIVPAVIFGTIGFFSANGEGLASRPSGTLGQLLIFVIAILLFAYFASRLKRSEIDVKSNNDFFKPFLLGISFVIVHILVSLILTGIRVPVLIYFLYSIVVLGIYWKILKKKKWHMLPQIILVGLGMYIGTATLGLVGALSSGAVSQAVAEIGFLIIFFVSSYKIKHKFQVKKSD